MRSLSLLECKSISYCYHFFRFDCERYYYYYVSLNTIRDPTKDKSIEIEMGWLCDESNMRFTHVPEEFLSAAQKCAEQHAEQSAEQTNVEEMQLEETKS